MEWLFLALSAGIALGYFTDQLFHFVENALNESDEV
jgi:hypothetical protein